MTNENAYLHPVSEAVQKGACLLGLSFGALLCWSAVFSFDAYSKSLDTVHEWCAKSNACTSMPTLFGSSILRVFDNRQAEASTLLGQLSQTKKVPAWARVTSFSLETVPSRESKAQESAKSAKRKAK